MTRQTQIEVEAREERGISEDIDVDAIDEARMLYLVESASGSLYRTTPNSCTCMDDEHRGEEEICKHQRRVQYVAGIKRVPVDLTDDDTPLIGAGEADHLKVAL